MPGSEGRTVVVVDDDPSMRQALHRMLRIGGFVPLMYGSAEAFLDEHRTEEAMCMILDVHLPGIDGFALHERLVALGSVPPVIFMTAYDEPEARGRAAKAGAVFLAKPFSGRLLLDALRSLHRAGDPGASPLIDRDTPV